MRPVPSPVRRKTTDSVSLIDNEFFVDGIDGGQEGQEVFSCIQQPSFMGFRFFHFPAQRTKQIVWTEWYFR